MSERKQLTLEELRQMVIDDNDCMAFVVVHDIKGNYDVAAVLDEVFGDGICAVYSAGPVEYMEKDYGKIWLAYAHEPPRLDRSAWEPCEYCGDPSPHRDCIIGDNVEQFLCPRDGLFQDAYINQRKIEFCPYCGRPLTDAAWDMLEKRLEVCK